MGPSTVQKSQDLFCESFRNGKAIGRFDFDNIVVPQFFGPRLDFPSGSQRNHSPIDPHTRRVPEFAEKEQNSEFFSPHLTETDCVIATSSFRHVNLANTIPVSIGYSCKKFCIKLSSDFVAGNIIFDCYSLFSPVTADHERQTQQLAIPFSTPK